MSVKHTYATTIKNDSGGTVVSDSTVYSADAEQNLSDTVNASSTKEIDLDITVANIVSFYIESDQDVTLKVNSTVSPDLTVSLSAKKAFWWNIDQLPTNVNPLTVNITKLYFINAGATVANLKGGFLVNQGI
jgi:hypothetical protein